MRCEHTLNKHCNTMPLVTNQRLELNEDPINIAYVHERFHELAGAEIEDETEADGDRQSG